MTNGPPEETTPVLDGPGRERRGGSGASTGATDSDSSRSPTRRRRFLALVGATSAGAVAGCASVGSDDEDPPGGFPGDAASVWVPIAPGNPSLGPTLVATRARRLVANLFHALVLPVREPTGEVLTSGHSWTFGDREVTVPCLVEGYERDADGRVRLRFDDRFSYWNGEPLDARVYWLRDRVRWLASGGNDRDASFDGELVSETEYLRPSHLGAFDAQSAVTGVHPGNPPLPPSVLEPAVERLESASTNDAVEGFDEVFSRRINLETFAEAGYGTGPYEIRSPDHIFKKGRQAGLLPNVTETAYAYRRDDYPASLPIPGIEVFGPASWLTKEGKFVGNATLDTGSGVIAADGDYTPEFVGEGIDQVATYPSPARRNSTLVFNWANRHLGRLWVRRGLVAAIPFDGVVDAVLGSSGRSPSNFVGLPSGLDDRVFDEAFLDSLVDYPVAADTELATTWLREAGYERSDGTWVGPDGNAVELELVTHGKRDRRFASEIKRSLDSFGIPVRTTGLRDFAYHDRVREGRFDLAISNRTGGWGTTSFYGDWFDAGDGWISTSVLTAVGDPPSSCREDTDAATPATITLPTEPGLRIDGVDYPDGGSSYHWPDAGGEERSVCAAAALLRRPDLDSESYREAALTCARWYNYAVPTVLFGQDRVGLWVDADEFVAPPADHPASVVCRHTPTESHYYHLLAGTFRPR